MVMMSGWIAADALHADATEPNPEARNEVAYASA